MLGLVAEAGVGQLVERRPGFLVPADLEQHERSGGGERRQHDHRGIGHVHE